jgi:nitrite reductase/ring-hydroxylating ferredoxin subunit
MVMSPTPPGREPLILRSDPPPPELPPGDLEQLVPWLAERLDALEQLDEENRARALAVLDGVDVLHRQSLARLVALIADLGGAGLLERIADDPQVRTLLELYELMPPAAGTQTSRSAEAASPLISIGAPPELRRPRWQTLGPLAELDDGRLHGRSPEGTPLLLARLGNEVHAFRDGCPPGSALLLVGGELDGTEIVCPWHGCRYDARSGRRTDGEEGRLPVVPVAIRDDEVRLTVGTEEVAR